MLSGIILLLVVNLIFVNSINTNVNIFISSNSVSVRVTGVITRYLPLQRQIIPLEQLREIQAVWLWDKQTIEFVTEEGRTLLPGNFTNVKEVIDLFGEALSL